MSLEKLEKYICNFQELYYLNEHHRNIDIVLARSQSLLLWSIPKPDAAPNMGW